MIKKGFVLALLAWLLFLGGCETTKGLVGGVAGGVSEGAKKDWAALKRVDNWMRENMW